MKVAPGRALSELVAEICAEMADEAPEGALREGIAAVAIRLGRPLTVAVAGQVSAGKSTLVNALLRRRIAPTGAGETTAVVTSFAYGYPERVELVMRDGGRSTLNLTPDGMLPRSLGAPISAVERVDVWVSEEILRGMTIVDTQGLGSAGRGDERTRELLRPADASVRAAAGADALVFVLNRAARRDDVEALGAFRAMAGGTRASAAAAVALLTKADRVDPDAENPWVAAKQLARDRERLLRGMVAAVIPVIGLLGETAGAGLLGEGEARALATLAALPDTTREVMLMSSDRFIACDSAVAETMRARLLELLGLHGAAQAIALCASGVTGAAALNRELLDLSGMMVVRSVIADTLAGNADALKASAALNELERLLYRSGEGWGAADLPGMRAHLERLRLHPDMYRLGLLGVLEAVAQGSLVLEPGEIEELRRVASTEQLLRRIGLPADADAQECRDAVLAAVARWKTRENRPGVSGAERAAAGLARRTYEHMWMALPDDGPPR